MFLFHQKLINWSVFIREARRVWLWRHMALILTGIVCVLFGSVFSEVIQTLFFPVSRYASACRELRLIADWA